ncbi:MAG: ATP-dependent zinc metalloprotease FtsH [Myxococcota bacterium]|nr:cell division protein FtsH [Deltaproteobacteria bacterium]
MNGRARFSILYYLVVFLAIFSLNSMLFDGTGVKKIPYSQFLDLVRQDLVEEVVLTEDTLYGLKKSPHTETKKGEPDVDPPGEHTPWRLNWTALKNAVSGYEKSVKDYGQEKAAKEALHFTVTPLDDPDLISLLQKHKVEFMGKIESKFFHNLFFNWILPFGAIFLIWTFLMRRMGKGPASLNMGNRQPKIVEADPENPMRFTDVAGVDEAVEEIQEVVAFLKEPADFTRLGAKLPKGILLAGPPGTGKTLLAKAVAGEAGVPFFSMSGSDFVEMFVGVGASRVRDLFSAAKAKAPCIIFIDELDAIGKSRSSQGATMGGYDERENTLNQLLVEMDGFDARAGVVLMAATNRPEVLDKALLRPGRFDRQIGVGRPYKEGRLAIFKIHARELKMADNVDLENLAAQTPGFVGADIANLCNEAALLASRRGHESVQDDDFQDAVERILGGLEKKGKVLGQIDRRTVAYHESGHAIVGWLTPGQDPVQKISIVPRGEGALGYTLQAPQEDRVLMSKDELEGKIRVLLGGRAAESLVFKQISTGASDDVEKASALGRQILTVYGMSEKLPNLSLVAGHAAAFLGEGPQLAPHSEKTAQTLDDELLILLEQAYASNLKLLESNRGLLDKLAQRLLQNEKVDQSDLIEILGPREGISLQTLEE